MITDEEQVCTVETEAVGRKVLGGIEVEFIGDLGRSGQLLVLGYKR